jgi:phosphohistidine phosphatase
VRVHLLRHAIAAPRDREHWPDDRSRPLTGDGRRRMARAAAGIATLGQRFDLVLSSPLIRAAETAKIVAAALHPSPEVKLLKPLAPGGGTGAVVAVLATFPADASILLVGHEPDLSSLVGALVLARREDLPIEFRKGSLCRIDFNGVPRLGEGRITFLLPPRILRRLRRTGAR